MPSDLPWEQAQESHASLYRARDSAQNKDEQNALARKEHQAFAREVVTENPLMAVPLAAAIPLYTGAKALGLTNARSDASFAEMGDAYKGVGQGLMATDVNPWEAAQAFAGSVVDTAKMGVEKVKQLLPWEEAQQYKPTPKAPIPIERKITMPKFDEVFSKLVGQESGGKHTDDKGNLITSPVGAQGITQLMPNTKGDPGFGVMPLRNETKAEYLRFGKDYLKAMVKEFNGDYEQALAAYNAGVGNVKKAIEKGGKDWKEFLPKKSETIPYINNILGKKDAKERAV